MAESLESVFSAASEYLEGGDPTNALALYSKAARLAVASGMQAELSSILGDMAVAQRRLGDVQAAIKTNRRAIEVARACGHVLNVARWSGNLGGLLLGEDMDGADACFREAVDAAARSGMPDQVGVAASNFAGLMAQRERFSEALDLLAKARTGVTASPEVASIIRQQEHILMVAWTHSLINEGRLREARSVVERGLMNLAGAPPVEGKVHLLILLADIEEVEGDIAAAATALQEAIETTDALGDQREADKLREIQRRMRG